MDEDRSWIPRALAIAGAGIAGLLLLAFVLLTTLDLSLFAHPIESSLSRALGRQVIISGEVRLIAFPKPALRLGGLYIANAPGGTRSDLLLARTIEAKLGLTGGWQPRLEVKDVTADQVGINLEPTSGGASWLLQGATPAKAGLLRIPGLPLPIDFHPASITATNLTLMMRLPWQAAPSEITAERMVADRSGPLGEHVAVSGKRDGETWQLDADLSSIEALVTGASFRSKGGFTGLGASVNFAGTASFQAALLTDVTGTGKVVDTGHFFGNPPNTGGAVTPAEFTFSIKNNTDLKVMTAKFLRLGTGDLDIALELRYRPQVALTGQISATTLDLQALPHGRSPTASDFLSTVPFAVEPLRRAQVDVKVSADTVSWGAKPIGRLELGLWANNGILAAGPVRLSGPAADIIGDATLDVRAAPKLSLTLKAKLLDLGTLLEPIGESSVSDGRVDVAVELLGTGNSAAEIMATAYGQTDLLIGPGHTGQPIAAALPTEITHGLTPDKVQAVSDAGLDVGCVISRFDIAGGRAVSRALMVETANAVTTGRGTIDFSGNQTLDFRLTPRPKDPALIGQAQDIVVSGTLRAPVFTPIEGEASRGLSRMAGQAALTQGFDALMPLLDPDAALANPCVRSLLGESALASLEAQVKLGGRSDTTARSIAQAP